MAIVWPTPLDVEAYVGAGRDLEIPRLACPSCSVPMSFWGWYQRALRVRRIDYELWVRRQRCKGCACSQAVLPEFVTWGRLDEVEVIGAAISALVGGKSGPEVAKGLGGPDRLPYTTVRDWGRRFAARAELIGAGFLAVVVALGALVPPLADRPEKVALVAIEAAWQSAERRSAGRVGTSWRTANAVIGSHLLSTNRDPPWAIA